jgi:large subunit ribosomal protein L29
MKAVDLRKFSIEELVEKISSLEEEQLRLRCNHATKQLENIQLVNMGRKAIARAKTILNEKQRQSSEKVQ